MYLLVKENGIHGVYVCLVLVFALALFLGGPPGNRGAAPARRMFFAISIFHSIPHHNLFLANVLAVVSSP